MEQTVVKFSIYGNFHQERWVSKSEIHKKYRLFSKYIFKSFLYILFFSEQPRGQNGTWIFKVKSARFYGRSVYKFKGFQIRDKYPNIVSNFFVYTRSSLTPKQGQY